MPISITPHFKDFGLTRPVVVGRKSNHACMPISITPHFKDFGKDLLVSFLRNNRLQFIRQGVGSLNLSFRDLLVIGVEGVSTRRVDDLVKALGCEGISKSQVSRIQELIVHHQPLTT